MMELENLQQKMKTSTNKQLLIYIAELIRTFITAQHYRQSSLMTSKNEAKLEIESECLSMLSSIKKSVRE